MCAYNANEGDMCQKFMSFMLPRIHQRHGTHEFKTWMRWKSNFLLIFTNHSFNLVPKFGKVFVYELKFLSTWTNATLSNLLAHFNYTKSFSELSIVRRRGVIHEIDDNLQNWKVSNPLYLILFICPFSDIKFKGSFLSSMG